MLLSAWGRPIVERAHMSETPSTTEFVVATAATLLLGIVLSFAAVYGIDRFFDEHEEVTTTIAGGDRGP
jgi:hypothetical protein